jgi:ferricrocin synthase
VPKGVKISHVAVSQALLAHDEHMPSFKRFLQFASPTFDVSVFETFFPLFRAATLVSRDREYMLADLPGTIRTMNVDAAELTPTVAGTLLKSREAAPCLQLLLTIGEMLTKPVLEAFGDSRLRSGILYAMYGPTEASIHCTIAAKIGSSSSIHNIGQPFATVTAVIIGASASESVEQYFILPKGQIGELTVAGQLASGYLNRPEQTATAFIDLAGYGLFYRTGDRARIAENGSLEILGRLSSDQVKLRGQRVELGEIESVACRSPGVVMAAASIINDGLVLFCVQDRDQVTANDVRSVCQLHLLRFMVPSDIVVLNLGDLPRLPSGKIDRKTVEMDYISSANTVVENHADELDSMTAQLCEIVSDVLGRHISSTSSLWKEGMNSLIAIEVASAVRAHHIEISVLDLLELENIGDVVARVKERQVQAKYSNTSTMAPVEDTDAFQYIQQLVEASVGESITMDSIEFLMPCNDVQVAMLAETASNEKLNFNYIELQVAPHISRVELCTAFQQLARKNEILRSGFVSVDHSSATFVQVVWKQLETDKDLSLLHPLCIHAVENGGNKFDVQIHHALYDGWSWDLIVNDLNCLLAAEATPERPQFRSVNRKQRTVQSSEHDAAEEYWGARLAGASPCSVPQLSHKRTQRPGKDVLRRVFKTAFETLVDLARKSHISSQTILSTALSLLLGSYTGSSDIIIGFVLSGRHIPVAGIEAIIGPCLSTLPLRVDLSAVSTVRDLLLYVDRSQLELVEHSTSSLHDVLAFAGISGQQKPFDTLFVWQEGLPFATSSFQLIKVIETSDCLDYALVVEAEPSCGEILVKLTYDTARIPQGHAECLLDQLDALTASLVANERLPLQHIWNVNEFNNLSIANAKTESSKPSFDLLSPIRDLAMRDPERTAILFTQDFDAETGVMHTKELSYDDLWRMSTETAHFLRSFGVGADDIVCVLVEKSLDLYVLDLAIIMAGGAFLNVDTRTPAERIAQILREVKCRLVVSGGCSFADPLDGVELPVVSLTRVKQGRQQYQGQPFSSHAKVNGSHLAYGVMTSGTTGIPKAILLTRDNLLSNIDVLSSIYPKHDDRDRLLQACSPAFDVFVFELFWTLHEGLCLCASPNDVLFRDIEGFIRAAKVTHLSLTPSVAALVHPDKVPDVKFLVTAGEPMTSKVFGDWAGRGLFQGYGPAETTNICNVKAAVQKDDLMNNVGPPFPNTSIFICAKKDTERLHDGLHILPTGAYGEILVGGSQVARGYADLHLTAKSFIHTKYGRLYRSGDMGRLLANGDLVVLEREDDQVKLRGQRVELGDINAVLLRESFVADAATFVVSDKQGSARLVSFWTYKKAKPPENATLSLYEMLGVGLLPYMIPEYLIPIEQMPLTRQGKIDRKALVQHFRDLDVAALQSHSQSATASDADDGFAEAEKSIVQALSEVTNEPLSEIKPHTSFFALGLDSISSVRFSQRLRQVGFGQVDVSVILRHCSVRRLCKELIKRRSISEKRVPAVSINELFDSAWRNKVKKLVSSRGHQVEKFLPCTGLQESILSAQANTSKASSYEACLKFEVKGDVDKLRTAWASIIPRHQVLRTCFAITASPEHAYAQVVLKDFALPWFVSDEKSAQETLEGIFIPPWRLLFENGRDGVVGSLKLTMSHALYDFEALSLLLRDIEHIYQSQRLKPGSEVDAYIQYMLNLDLNDTDTFWQHQLRDFNPQSFRALFQSLELEDIDENTQRTFNLISSVPQHRLQAAAEGLSTTPSTLFQAAWARLLSCYTKCNDIVFGNVFSGRNLPLEGVTDIVAPLFNTLPLRVRLTDRQSMRDLVAEIQKTVFEILPLQPSSLRHIVRNQQLGGRQLFDTLALVQSGDLTLDESIWLLREEEGDMDFPGVIIEIVSDTSNSQLMFKLHVQSANIDSSTAHQILRNYDAILQDTVQYPQGQASDFASIAAELPALRVRSPISWKTPSPEPVVETNCDEQFTALELNIRQLFSQFSGIDIAKIERETTIFELGLDSLNVVQIASELRQFGHKVTGADVLEANTVGRLAKVCVSVGNHEGSSNHNTFDLDAFDQSHRTEICEQLQIRSPDILAVRPCTSTQSGILTEFISSKGQLYFNCVILDLQPDVDLARVKNAWQAVMDRNEMLRTGFVALSTSKHPYIMVTYGTGALPLPWLVEADVKTEQSEMPAKFCLQNLQKPCWHLLVKKGDDLTRLEVYLLHSLYDANSLDGLLSEVAALYRDEGLKLSNPTPVAPALCMIIDQTKASGKDSEDFWKDMAAGAQPFRFPNLNIQQIVASDTVTISRICASLLQDLNQSCRRLGVSLQSVCQVSWAKILAAYTGESMVMFGTVLSGRTRAELADVLFPTINTVPFCVQTRDSTVNMLIEANKINTGLFKHQCTPMTTIKRWLEAEGECFDTILVLQNNRTSQSEIAPWKIVEDRATAEYAVSLEILPEDDNNLEIRITTRLDTVPTEHVKIMLRQYETYLRQIARENDSNAVLVEKLLSIVPVKDEMISTDVKLLHDFVEVTTKKTPEATALEFAYAITDTQVDKQSWSYRQLTEESNKIAHLLISRGAKPGQFVAVCFDKCPEASFAILGILKAGCAYVAIDPSAPILRKRFILEDARCQILLTTEHLCFSAENGGKITMLAVDDQDLLRGHPTTKPTLERPIQLSDTCYCLYTSGTTGQPKGCLISHNSAVQAMLSFQRIFAGHWDRESRWLQFASFHFDVSVLEQYWSWSVGICVTSAPRDVLFENIAGAIDALQITHLDLTPSLARLLKPEQVPSLCRGVFIVGGEQVTQDIIDTWGDVGCLYNFYGPSEVTIGCTVHKRVKKGVKATNIGQPWDNVGAFVLEPGSERPVMRGAVGELCLSGPLVGKGYLNRPELTAEKFVTLKMYDTRVYRSGDLVRLLHDDSFEFLGRIDDQVKLRGQRLEIREIDLAIKQAANIVVDVATMVVKSANQPTEQLVAFFTIRGKITNSSELARLTSTPIEKLVVQIRRRLEDSLPAYMVPTHLLPVSHIPLSANNKADLKALKAFFAAAPIRSLHNMDWNGSSIVPLTETTRKLIATLAAFLGVPEFDISPLSRLFQLGLDSISAVALAGVLRGKGFRGVDAATVMRRPVVADLAQELDASSEDDYEKAVEAAEHDIELFREAHKEAVSSSHDVESFWPCTPLQEDMLSKAINRGSEPYYLSAFHYILDKSVGSKEVMRAWTQAQDAFPILRTTFLEASSKQFGQLVHQHCIVPVRHLELVAGADVMTVLHQGTTEWCNNVDLLGNDPAWEVEILEASTGQCYMSLKIFHGLYDANSLSVLLNEVANLIRSGNVDIHKRDLNFHRALPFGPLCHREGAKDFWVKHLSTPSLLQISPQADTPDGTSTTYSIKHALPEHFASKRNELGVTDSAVFEAACLLSLHTNYGIFASLGLVVSGRSFPVAGVESICGPLFNTIPFQISPRLDWSHADLIKACHDFNVESKPFEHTSLTDIRDWIDLEPGKPLFDTLFVFQKETMEVFETNEDLWREMGQATTPDYPLSVEVSLRGDIYNLTIVADPEFLSEGDVCSLSVSFSNALEQLIGKSNDLLVPGARQAFKSRPQTSSKRPIDPQMLEQVRSQIALLAEVDSQDIDDSVNVFSLGLDSISLIKLSGALRKRGLPITVNMIMRLSTPTNMAYYLTERNARPGTSSQANSKEENPFETAQIELTSALQKHGESIDTFEHIWPVTPMQEGVLASFEKYYHFALLKLSPGTHSGRLLSAWNSAIKLHPVLRTTFVEIDDPATKHIFAQVTSKPQDSQFEEVDIDNESQLQDLAVRHSDEMTKAGLEYPSIVMKLITVKTSGTRYILLGMSHAIYDGWSIQLLHEDIVRLYYGETVRRPSIEPYLQYVMGPSPEEASTFWKQQISDLETRRFPRLSIDQTSEPKSHRLVTTSHTGANIVRQFCKTHTVTVQTLGLAIWTAVLASYIQSTDVCFGVVLACRNEEDADQLMFPTFNTVPFRPQFDGGSYRDLVKHVHQLSLLIAEHQDFPMREIKKSRIVSGELFDTLFVMQTRSNSDKIPKLYKEADLGESPSLDYPVNVEMEIGEKLTWTVAASGTVLDKNGVADLLERLETTLEAVIQDPDVVAMQNLVRKDAREPSHTHFDMFTDDANEPRSQDSRAQDPFLRTTVFEVIASVARCSIDTLFGTTNIYSLGLDSISVIKVTGLLRKQGISLPVSMILSAVTLDRVVSNAKRTPPPGDSAVSEKVVVFSSEDIPEDLQSYLAEHDIPHTAIDATLPASAGQIFMLDFYQTSNKRLFYQIFRYKIQRSLVSEDQILNAWRSVIEALPALRTRFVEHNGTMWQLAIRADSINQHPPAAHLAVTRHAEDFIIELRLHHSLYDAVSLPIVISAFEKACQGQALELTNSLPALQSFISATRDPDAKATRKDFWTRYLASANIGRLSNTSSTFEAKRLELVQQNATPNTAQLTSLAGTAGLSLQSLFLAAAGKSYAALLAPSQDKVVVGVYLANRGLDIHGLETLAAPTVSIVPLVVDVRSGLRESASRIQGDLALLQRAECCGVSLREVCEWTGGMVECFVNFLPRMESTEREDEDGDVDMYGGGAGDGEKIRLEAYPLETREDAGKELISPFVGPEPKMEMPWCVPGIDVEAKLEDDGGLTVGVFAPEDRVDRDGLKGLLERIREVLGGFQ